MASNVKIDNLKSRITKFDSGRPKLDPLVLSHNKASTRRARSKAVEAHTMHAKISEPVSTKADALNAFVSAQNASGPSTEVRNTQSEMNVSANNSQSNS